LKNNKIPFFYYVGTRDWKGRERIGEERTGVEGRGLERRGMDWSGIIIKVI
jgi:hypothetical protein